ELLLRIDTLAKQLRTAELVDDSSGRSKVAFFRTRLEVARSEYEALAVAIAETHSSRSAVAGSTPIGAGTVRGHLLPGEALLEYLVSADSLFLFAATPARVVALA